MFTQILKLIKQISKAISKLQMKVLFLRICKEEGLKQNEIDLLAAVVNCESGFNDKAVNKNVNGSTDFGICQFNDDWYWNREQVIHPDVALNNPRVAIRTMIKQYKKGRLKDWVCYSSNLWRKYKI